MYYFRPSNQRGQFEIDWLSSRHSFSFGHYYDPDHMGFSVLRVINDDLVQPGAGFDAHPHRDMEIITYILEGSIEHKDSMGKHHIIPAGNIQCMSAGKGIIHSEYNYSRTEPLRFLQIWIQPNTQNLPPHYQQISIKQTQELTLLVSPNGRNGSLTIQQDASIYRLQLNKGQKFRFDTNKRPGYLHIIAGTLIVNQELLGSGDAIGAYNEQLIITADSPLTALWFDLPK